MNQRIVMEVKNRGGQYFISEWLAEAEIERRNDDAGVGMVVAKRRGIAGPGKQVVIMTVDDLIALITGFRPDNNPVIPVTSPEADPWAEVADRACVGCGRNGYIICPECHENGRAAANLKPLDVNSVEYRDWGKEPS